MTSLSGNVTASYAYRADGMRVSKQTGGVTTLYRHDGQMGIEDVEAPTSGAATVTRYGLGARGVDLIERTDPQGHVVTAFPIYDAHGNDVASLTRNGTSFAIGDRRTYDAWGVVRAQQSSGDPKLRYCASLGHKADDESGLIYMRARYYEPSSGRFVSEDTARQGRNWQSYCAGDPVNRVDHDGKDWSPADMKDFALLIAGVVSSKLLLFSMAMLAVSGLVSLTACCTCGFGAFAGVYILCAGTLSLGSQLNDTIAEQGFWPKITPKEGGGFRTTTGGLGDVAGFLSGWYANLDFLFRHVDDIVAVT